MKKEEAEANKQVIGTAAVENMHLAYFIFSTEGGFGVGIEKTQREQATACSHKSKEQAIALANSLHRGLVFPGNLQEIVEDLEFAD